MHTLEELSQRKSDIFTTILPRTVLGVPPPCSRIRFVFIRQFLVCISFYDEGGRVAA